MEKVIEIEHLTKSYGKFKAIDDLSIYVEKGKISGVLQLNNINFFETLDIALFFLSIFLYFLFVLFGTL